MAIINQSNILNLQPGITAPVVVHMSEGDVGTKLSFKLIDGARAWTDPGNVVAAVHGRRQDGTQFGPYACTISGDVVSFETDAAMAGAAGSGIAEIVLGSGGSVSVANTAGFKAISGKIGTVPYILFLVLILAVIAGIILGRSTFGRRVYAIGTNRLAARYSGVAVQKIRFIIYTAMGFFAGLSALFIVGKSGGANTTTGTGFEMDAIAMAVFGGISSTGGKGNMIGGFISAFIIVCLRIGLGQRNVNGQVILLIIGVLLIAAVALPNIFGSLRRAVKK